MQFFSRRLVRVVFVVFLLACSFSSARAAETPVAKADPIKLSMTADPMASYTFVSGDSSKFRALHWAPQGFVAGIREFSASGDLSKDVAFESEGHAVPEEGDYAGAVSLTKEEMGYVKFSFDQFRKYYANGGGFYSPYPEGSQLFYTDKELALNIGKLSFEAGLTLKNIPEIIFNYDRDYKEGTKSRTTWGSVYDTTGTIQKKINPSWQNIDEVTDSFNLKMSDTLGGFNWKANQHLEYMRANNQRRDQYLSLQAVADTSSRRAITEYNNQPRSDMMLTTLNMDRWFMKDKVYTSGGYQFSQVKSRELYNILVYKPDGTRNASGFAATDTLDSPSDNLFTSHTWVASLMSTWFEPLTAITRFKINTYHRQSSSTYLQDTNTDGIINRSYVSENQEKVIRYGESVSFRYSGFSWMALYNDYDFEQFQSNLEKNRTTAVSATSSDIYDINNLENTTRGTGTLGAQMVPWKHVVMTMQGQHRMYDSNFDHTIFSVAPQTTLIPTWYDSQKVTTDEATARLSWKPCRWFQPTFRYQLSDKNFETETQPDADVPVTTTQISSTYTWDLSSQPNDDLLMTASFSYQDGKIITPTRMDGAFPLPTFDFDVYTTLFTTEYVLTKDLILSATADYTRAANFNDYSSISVPYGADFHMADLTVGLRWQAKKDLTIEPKYAWYQYTANESEVGSYTAQLISLEGKMKW